MWTKQGGGIDQILQIGFPVGTRIIVQHDGAKPHTGHGNEESLDAAGAPFGISFVTQPANSPDLNWNDLAFFYSLQCDTNELKGVHCDLWKLKEVVVEAFKQYPSDKLERIDALQYEIYRQIIEHDGGNDFPMPHSGIRNRQKNDQDVADRGVSQELYEHMCDTILELEARVL